LTVSSLKVQDDVAKGVQALEGLRREAKAAPGLSPSEYCTVYEIGHHEGRRFIAVEYLEGETLKHVTFLSS